jgi:N utilization substance protein B
MLTRRHIRIKILQNLYAANIACEIDLQKSENRLIKSVESLYDLYIYQLSFIKEFFDFCFKKIEEGKNKFLPSPEDLHPNLRFVKNPVLLALDKNPALNREIDRIKISWTTYPELFRNIYNNFTNSSCYNQYMSNTENSFKKDKTIVQELYYQYILSSESFEDLFDDMVVGWSDDLFIAAFFVEKTFDLIKKNKPFTQLPSLFKEPEDWHDGDYAFMIELQRQVLLHDEEFQQIIAKHTHNWEYERIPYIDVIILKMALTELHVFPSIPIKVTLNEYIDLAKMFSTPKSSMFINGILDKLLVELTESGKIQKDGRGLIE